jgi:hypothetical protein
MFKHRQKLRHSHTHLENKWKVLLASRIENPTSLEGVRFCYNLFVPTSWLTVPTVLTNRRSQLSIVVGPAQDIRQHSRGAAARADVLLHN